MKAKTKPDYLKSQKKFDKKRQKKIMSPKKIRTRVLSNLSLSHSVTNY